MKAFLLALTIITISACGDSPTTETKASRAPAVVKKSLFRISATHDLTSPSDPTKYSTFTSVECEDADLIQECIDYGLQRLIEENYQDICIIDPIIESEYLEAALLNCKEIE